MLQQQLGGKGHVSYLKNETERKPLDTSTTCGRGMLRSIGVPVRGGSFILTLGRTMNPPPIFCTAQVPLMPQDRSSGRYWRDLPNSLCSMSMAA